MANTKISDLTAATSLASTDLLTAVVDPGGTPANRKITVANVMASLFTSAGTGPILTTPDGLHTYRVAVDNNGVLTTEQLT